MAETSGTNNPRENRGKHASQPLLPQAEETQAPALLESADEAEASEDIEDIEGAEELEEIEAPSVPVITEAPTPASMDVVEPTEAPVVPAAGTINPYSRAAAGSDYAVDRKRKKRKKILLGVLVTVLVLVLGGASAAWAYINSIENTLNDGIDMEVIEALEQPAAYEGETFYMLLMGTDKSKERDKNPNYGDGNYRSDSMILARIDPTDKKVTLVSLHRDTEVEIEGYGIQKLNASYQINGPAGAIKAVSDLAGVPISHYAEINFDGFKEVVDALGGITVKVPIEINDPEAGGHLDAGKQKLNGEQALILCRSRHSYDQYGDGDRYRAANQRMVIGAIAKKILQSDPATMTAAIQAMAKYVTTDFKVADILTLANSLKDLDPKTDIYSAMEPTEGVYRDDTWYEQLDVEGWKIMMDRVRAGLPPTAENEIDEITGVSMASVGDGTGSASDDETGVEGGIADPDAQKKTFSETRTGIVTIKNGNGIDGVGAEALERIKPLGYTADASNANSFSYDETVVVFDTPDQRVYAEELVRALGCGRAVQNKNGEYVYEGDFLILIGSDWQ